jgi:peptidoglycan LD-endopeptidase CwlK
MSRSLADLSPTMQPLAKLLISKCAAAGITLLVVSTLRTNDEQTELFSHGRTKLFDENGKKLGIVTNAKAGQSRHNTGDAIDVVPTVNGVPQWSTVGASGKVWEKMGKLGESLGLVWGGRWGSLSDYPHFEIRKKQENLMDDFEQNGASVDDKIVKVDTPSKLPTLKSATAAAAVTVLLAALPAIAMVVPQIQPFVGAINAIAKLFGYGV